MAMPTQQTVLLLGGSGRTGHRVLTQLLGRGLRVRVIVRSSGRLPPGAASNPNVEVVEASLLSLADEELLAHLRGCDAVVSCLGHVLSLRGVYGPPYGFVARATARLCRAIEALRPARPIKFVLMSSVSVNHPAGLDTRRGGLERAFVGLVRALLPPAMDNQRAADFLYDVIGTSHPSVQWVAVRPDTLLDGDVSEYTVHAGLVNSLFAPGSSNMANVAHLMCELVTNAKTWDDWKGRLPVIVNAADAKR
jgi:nucleoside-diphosphate-sugar epimerase